MHGKIVAWNVSLSRPCHGKFLYKSNCKWCWKEEAQFKPINLHIKSLHKCGATCSSVIKSWRPGTPEALAILSRTYKLSKRLPSNIGLLLRKLLVVDCFHSRQLTICKHSCDRHISWAFRSAISGKQAMFTNHKAFAMEADNNSQHTQ